MIDIEWHLKKMEEVLRTAPRKNNHAGLYIELIEDTAQLWRTVIIDILRLIEAQSVAPAQPEREGLAMRNPSAIETLRDKYKDISENSNGWQGYYSQKFYLELDAALTSLTSTGPDLAGLLLRAKPMIDFMADDYEDGGTEKAARKLSVDIDAALALLGKNKK